MEGRHLPISDRPAHQGIETHQLSHALGNEIDGAISDRPAHQGIETRNLFAQLVRLTSSYQ